MFLYPSTGFCTLISIEKENLKEITADRSRHKAL